MMRQLRGSWDTFLQLRAPASVPARMTIWLYALYAVGQGIGICLGGIVRWSGPGYTIVRQLPGSPYSWGVALSLFGILLGVASARKLWGLKAVALVLIVVWSVAFASGAFVAAATVPGAGTTGGPVYLLTAAAAAVLIMLDERRRPHETPPT